MNLISQLLVNWSKYKDFKPGGQYSWVPGLFDVLNPLLFAIMAVVGGAGAIYAIVLGVNLARAEDTSKRDEAKKRLIYVLIAVAVTIALVLFFTMLLPDIIVAFMKPTEG